MERVYILGACRTPIGKMGGALSTVSAVDLGAIVIREAIRRAGISPEQVDHVNLGCVLQAALGQNVARQASLKARIPFSTTAQTLNVVCGSGLEAVNASARLIQAGDAEIVVAGGTESMSQAPFAITGGRFGYRMGSPMVNTPLIDTMVNDALWDAVNDYHMGITAENVATQWGLSRQELDAFAADSQSKAVKAQEAGAFREEIVPIVIREKKSDTVVDTDEGPRPGTTVEALAKLRPAFKPDGLVTAGNSSGINDGAAAVVLVSERMLRELGLKPQALWLGSAMAGVDPAIMGVGPVASTEKLLKKMNMTIDEIDLFEANEAFAAQSLAVKRELGIASEKLNVNGGAIALGHPVGASGCRILVTLIHAMKKRGVKTGLATLCVGGGMGCSTMIRMEPDDV
ncbi:MAG: acetyl-CoA C-acetyltransferase [Oscillospiraceae bacterium]|nr:acetyl-CoA C-acetyltransferase [Oscillospiraceae bacterium]